VKGSTGRAKRIAVVVAGLVGVQVAAVLAYRAIQSEKPVSGLPTEFEFERLALEARGLDAALPEPKGGVTTLRAQVGKPLIVHFWATWCEPCRAELPKLVEFGQTRGVRISLISVDESWEVVRHFFDGNVPVGVVLDKEGTARNAFGISTLPDTYLLDATGRPMARFHGPRNWTGERARASLDRLLADAERP
jgi:thiol-disulfide isomerase/thioredoxin